MKVGICTIGVGPCSTGDFIRRSAVAAEQAGFASFWGGDHTLLFGATPSPPIPMPGSTRNGAIRRSPIPPCRSTNR